MLTVKLALRGLWRHKVRTAITLAAVSFGHCLGLVFVTVNDGGHEQMVELGVRQGRAGHVVVQAKGYQQTQSVERVVANPARVETEIHKALPDVKVAPRVFGGGLARTAADSVGVFFSGVDPPVERTVNLMAKRMVRGVYLGASPAAITAAEKREKKPGALWCARPPGPGDPPRTPVVVGALLAKTLNLDLCSSLVLDAQGMGTRESMKLQVVGIFRYGSTDLDGSFVSLRLPDAQRMLHLGQSVHQVAIFAKSLHETERTRAAVAAAVTDPSLVVLPWDKAMPELAEFIWLDKGSGYVFLIIVYLIIGIGILNTILMSVMERTREFGVMRAIGASPWRVVWLVIGEGALIGLLGVIIGTVTGMPIVHYLETTGIDLSQMSEGAMEMGGMVMTVMKGKLYASSAIWASVGIFGMAVAAAIYPAIRAAKVQVLRAIHQA